MKRNSNFISVLIACVMISCWSFEAKAQQDNQETVYLKNGSVIHGVIIEQRPNEQIKIQTPDGSVFICNITDVEKITKNVPIANVQAQNPAVSAAAAEEEELAVVCYRPKGYRGFGDFSAGTITDTKAKGFVSFSTSHGYQFNPYFFMGAGLGLDYNSKRDRIFMPIFANVRFNIINKRVSPYIDLRGGYSPISDADGGYFNFSTGVSIMFKPRFGLYAGFTYTMQQMSVIRTYTNYSYSTNRQNLSFTENEYMHYVGFKVGLEF